jgi:hypothetical protein
MPINECANLFINVLSTLRWKTLSHIGWDWQTNVCDNNTSDKSWFCGIQLNRSKLKLFTDMTYKIVNLGDWTFTNTSTGEFYYRICVAEME